VSRFGKRLIDVLLAVVYALLTAAIVLRWERRRA